MIYIESKRINVVKTDATYAIGSFQNHERVNTFYERGCLTRLILHSPALESLRISQVLGSVISSLPFGSYADTATSLGTFLALTLEPIACTTDPANPKFGRRDESHVRPILAEL